MKYSIPKEEWGEGPWQNESDEYEFEYRDIKCRVLRNKLGAWCGYIEIVKPDEWGDDYEEFPIEVHGGLTFYDEKSDTKPDDNKVVIGFDCCHYFDQFPITSLKLMQYLNRITKDANVIEFSNKMLALEEIRPYIKNETYKDISFVIKECKSMVDQYLNKQDEKDE